MLNKFFIYLVFTVLFIPYLVFSQDQNINFDTIRISSDIPAKIIFPPGDEIQDVEFLCANNSYSKLIKGGNEITIRMNKAYEEYLDHPEPPDLPKPKNCILNITEGQGDNKRQHMFVMQPLSPDADVDPSSLIYNLKTVENIKARIDYLAKCKQNKEGNNNSSKTSSPAIPPPPASTPAPENPAPAQAAETTGNTITADSINIGGYMIAQSSLKTAIKSRLSSFNQFLNTLGMHPSNSKEMIDACMKLFNNNEEKIVELSIPNKPKIIRKIRDYLTRLSNLPYSKVSITFSKVEYVSKVRLGPDGLYYGSVSYLQTMVGYGENGQIKFQSSNEKTIEIVLKITEEVKGSEKNGRITVYLGNTSLSQEK